MPISALAGLVFGTVALSIGLYRMRFLPRLRALSTARRGSVCAGAAGPASGPRPVPAAQPIAADRRPERLERTPPLAAGRFELERAEARALAVAERASEVASAYASDHAGAGVPSVDLRDEDRAHGNAVAVLTRPPGGGVEAPSAAAAGLASVPLALPAEPTERRRFRLEFTRRHIVFALAFTLLAAAVVSAGYIRTLRHVEAKVGELRSVTVRQRARLRQIDERATELDSELRGLAHQNEQIRKLIGDPARPPRLPQGRPAKSVQRESSRTPDAFAEVADRIARLRADSSAVRDEGNHLRGFALRILNMHRLEELARARVLAAIPSVNPAGAGVAIRSPYGWRADPWPEFHAGVDLDLDFGDPVRAAAAGTVVAAEYDGGYGLKVDVDHGNGYHTWYCHLSRIDVRAGQYVMKSQHIAFVGSTGASTGPHLHYQIMLDGKAVDPTPYLSGVPARVLASLK